MSKKIKQYLRLFWKLLKTDLIVFKQYVVDKVIDTNIWTVGCVGIFAYIMPKLGLDLRYGAFYAVSAIASCAIFEVWSATCTFVSDLCGRRVISYPLTLPLPSWLVLVKNAFTYACHASVVTIVVLPLGKLILWDRMDLSQFSLFRFVIMFLSINIFVGFFALFNASLVKNMNSVGSVWMRVIFPAWLLGGSQFSWHTMHEVSPKLAYANFVNPLLYPMEGIRAAVLGQEGYLSFGICLFAMWLFIFIFGWVGIRRIKKRLDFV